MRYHGCINYVKCVEWGLNIAQGALFDLINESISWAKPYIIDDEVYYWVSRNKVLDELPVVYKRSDTVYRNLKILESKKLITYKKQGSKDLVALTEKGKSWNSKIKLEINPNDAKSLEKNPESLEINPSNIGDKSENTTTCSDINPTDKNTSVHKGITNKEEGDVLPPTKKVMQKEPNSKFNPSDYPIPDFVDKELWNRYHDMRRSIKKPCTEFDCNLLVKEFNDWYINGLDVNSSIKNSIISKWAGVFKPKQSVQGSSNEINQSADSQSDSNHFKSLRQQAANKYGKGSDEIRTVSG